MDKMSLVAVGAPAWNTARGVRFGILFGATLIEILFTHEAIEFLAPSAGELGGHLTRFSLHRKRFERVAARMQEQGAWAEAWDILIDREHLEGR
jgi:hypothetical protein